MGGRNTGKSSWQLACRMACRTFNPESLAPGEAGGARCRGYRSHNSTDFKKESSSGPKTSLASSQPRVGRSRTPASIWPTDQGRRRAAMQPITPGASIRSGPSSNPTRKHVGSFSFPPNTGTNPGPSIPEKLGSAALNLLSKRFVYNMRSCGLWRSRLRRRRNSRQLRRASTS